MWQFHCIKCGNLIVSNVAISLYQMWRLNCIRYGDLIVSDVAKYKNDFLNYAT